MTKTCRMASAPLWLLICVLSISACSREEAEPTAPAQETQEQTEPEKAPPAEPQAAEASAGAAATPIVVPPRPDAIPADLPQLLGFTTQEVTGGSGASYQVVLSGQGAVETVRQSYEAELVKQGWSVDASEAVEHGHITLASQGHRSISLALTQEGEQVEAIFSFIDPTQVPLEEAGEEGEEGELGDDSEGAEVEGAAEDEGMAEDPAPAYPDGADDDGGEAGDDEAQD